MKILPPDVAAGSRCSAGRRCAAVSACALLTNEPTKDRKATKATEAKRLIIEASRAHEIIITVSSFIVVIPRPSSLLDNYRRKTGSPPANAGGGEVFSGGDTIPVFTPVKLSELVPAPGALFGLFDLTRADTSLAINVASGQPVKAAADAIGIKFTTARSCLEQIFRKTGTIQQSQLVALLKSASAIR
ncbi:hypothetical protein QRQ56_05240 [Bradyrhizobium sp. U531]|uniref:helix-turn-helix transcriptional regulator n=1 Tax=Bradyrhizobium sp. U531 TaxID=3053458 RepID=UPI003F423A73